MLSKKDLIAINQEFHNGSVVNESSLDYVVSMTKRSKNWLKTAALLTRAVLVDHVFEDGNKRTAAAAIMACAEIQGVHCNPDRVNQLVIKVILKNVTDVRTIERLIKNAIE